jgi:dCMP deaminase
MPLFSRKDIQFLMFCVEGASIFSTCGKKQYMAILTDDDYMVLGMGYNGGPPKSKHCNEGGCPRLVDGSESGSIYDNCVAVHAEQNALIHSDHSSKPTKLFVNGPPCFTCAKLIVNSTIKSVFYIRDENYKDWSKVSKFMKANGLEVLGFASASTKD